MKTREKKVDLSCVRIENEFQFSITSFSLLSSVLKCVSKLFSIRDNGRRKFIEACFCDVVFFQSFHDFPYYSLTGKAD